MQSIFNSATGGGQQWLFVALVGVFTMTAAILDLRTRKLPNWLTVSALILALIFHALTGGWQGLLSALTGFAVGFSLLLVLWLVGGGGGGDVKLMGALGAWLGPRPTLFVFVLSALIAVVGSCVLSAYRMVYGGGRPVPAAATGRVSAEVQARPSTNRGRMALPYALPVAVGTWLVLAWKIMLA